MVRLGRFPLPQGDCKTPGFQPGPAWHRGRLTLSSGASLWIAPQRHRRRHRAGGGKTAFASVSQQKAQPCTAHMLLPHQSGSLAAMSWVVRASLLSTGTSPKRAAAARSVDAGGCCLTAAQRLLSSKSVRFGGELSGTRTENKKCGRTPIQ